MPYKSVFLFFWPHIKPYKWFYLLMMAAPIVASFNPFAYNYSIKLIIDIMTTHDQITYHNLLYPILLFVGAQLTLETVYRLSNIAQWHSEPYVKRSLLLTSYDYVQHHSYLFFQNSFTGGLSSKIKGILDGYDKFKTEMHHGLASRILKCMVNLWALCFVNVRLGLFVFVWGLVYVPVMYRLSLQVNQLSFEESESRHALIGQISDKITNMISLFSFATRRREYNSLEAQITHDYIPKQVRAYHYSFVFQIVGGILYLIMLGFIFFYMIHLRKAGLISIGDFAFVFGITLVVSEDVWLATISLQDFSRAMGDLKSAISILKIPQQNLDEKNATVLTVQNPKIEFRKVGFAYAPENPVFNDLNLTIQPGEKVGLVGYSGSGKSSLINLLLRYFKNDSGEIFIDGQNISHATQDSLRNNIAVIPQDTMLFHRTIMENIRYGNLSATDEEVIEASKKAHVHEFIMTLPEQYEAFVGERGIKLSGGQRQRVAIARAFLKDAPILILDEATSSLDSQTEKLIQESLNILIEDKRKTVIAIAHRLSTLKHMDRVIVLDKGRIVEEGTHNTLIADDKSLYKKLWKLQEIS